jgi:DNA adenine methylase
MLSSDTAGPPVSPARPAFPYMGGKKLLAKTIIAEIVKVSHDLYGEPFIGGAGVFLRRPEAVKTEVINDLNRDVATFFRVLQRHEQAFFDMLEWRLSGRDEFDRLMKQDPETLTDLERAARFLYLQRMAVGGKVEGRHFGANRMTSSRFNLPRLLPILEEVHERLARVVIECLPFDRFIERYDRPGALFYLDPPYYGCETYYGRGMFARSDFERIAEILRALKGRFILSINDVPPIRELFDGFAMRQIETTYTAGQAKRIPATELLITNGG